MQNKKYGIWKTRYAENSRNIFEDWVRTSGEPILFATASDDSALLESINTEYGIEIPYDNFMRSYTWTMNTTINEYMFTNESTKNCADMAAWANNAYISGWGYMSGAVGERNESDRIRYSDNAELMLGYLNYNSAEKTFGNAYETLVYTEQGDIDTMPEIAGIGLFDGTQHGIYVGNGEVVFSSADCGYVTKDLVSNGSWTSWCTYDGVDYPQKVWAAIDGLSDDNSENDSSESAAKN